VSDEEIIMSILNNPERCPCLFIGKFVPLFKKLYQGRIFNLTTLDSVRELVNRFAGLSDLEGRFFVIDGIGFISPAAQNSLLKFIEESKFPIILLSYYDKVSSIIHSRVKFVYKRSPAELKTLKFIHPKDAFNIIEEKKKKDPDFSEMDEVKFYADNCPAAYALRYSLVDYDNYSMRLLRVMVGL